jgi:hypothetical protein
MINAHPFALSELVEGLRVNGLMNLAIMDLHA